MAEVNSPDLILTNGKFTTLDPGQPEVGRRGDRLRPLHGRGCGVTRPVRPPAHARV